jgi:hypothetical protein
LSKIICFIIAILVFFLPAGAVSQVPEGEEAASLQAQKDALFQQMLSEPGNLDVTFAYADVSARLGDYEAAVSALERMPLFNPDLPRVQLELGRRHHDGETGQRGHTADRSRQHQLLDSGTGHSIG